MTGPPFKPRRGILGTANISCVRQGCHPRPQDVSLSPVGGILTWFDRHDCRRGSNDVTHEFVGCWIQGRAKGKGMDG
jgi:hypothetical protein